MICGYENINKEVVKRFGALQKKNRLAHAYLFVGPVSVGKRETALAVARLLNCEDPQDLQCCQQCPSCRKINGFNHPDVHCFNHEEDGAITIEQVRSLLTQVRLRPFMAGQKVFVVCNIENLTLEAANALLKTLEEPSKDSLLILTTSVPEKNLDTIKSRCHMVYFPTLAQEKLALRLIKEEEQLPNDAHFLAYFAQGCLGRARALKGKKFLNKKDELVDEFILRRANEDFVKKVLADKTQTKMFLEVLLSWLRDALLVQVEVRDERLIHLDRLEDLKEFSNKYTFKEVSDLYEETVKMCKLLADNLNIKIPLLIIGEKLWEK